MSEPTYPQSPYPGQPIQTAVKPAKPGTVTGALLIYVIAAIAVVVGVLGTINSDVWKQALADVNSSANQSLVNTAKTFAVVIGVVIAAVYLFFAFMMWGGRNWARIVLTVFSALSIVSSFRTSASVTVNGRVYSSTSSNLYGYLGAGLAVLAIILMFVGASNAYFRNAKAYRKGPKY